VVVVVGAVVVGAVVVGAVVVVVLGAVVVGVVVVVVLVVVDSGSGLGFGFGFGTCSLGSPAAPLTCAVTFASPIWITFAGAGPDAAASGSFPPPALAMPNAAAKATTATPAMIRI